MQSIATSRVQFTEKGMSHILSYQNWSLRESHSRSTRTSREDRVVFVYYIIDNLYLAIETFHPSLSSLVYTFIHYVLFKIF